MGGLRLLFGMTIFGAALLLFAVEPMAAKELLPVLGGASAVWVTCLVFFQAMLLLGYAYAYGMTRVAGWGRGVHLALLAGGAAGAVLFAGLPVRGEAGAAGHPVATIFLLLGTRLGLPFLLLGATSPLLQVWMARMEHEHGVRYGFFALSNVGSLLGLVLYPVVIEPHVTLRAQRIGWAVGYGIVAAMAGVLGRRPEVWRVEAREDEAGKRTTGLVRAMWFLLPMGATVQLAAVTSHLTVNIAAIPLLWMLPLAAYLLTFIVAFRSHAAGGQGLYRRGIVVRLLVVMVAGLGYALTKTDSALPIGVAIPFFLLELFSACLFCHAEVYRMRPAGRREATQFYLTVAAGGVTGTFLVAIVSPLVFRANYDLAFSFLLVAVLALVVTWEDGWGQRLLWGVGSGLLLALVLMLHIAYGRRVVEVRRNFYGTLRVTETSQAVGPVRMLTNGTIQHGTQIESQPGLERVPTTYYATDSGVGLAIANCCAGRARQIGVVGLGVGTLAAYGRAGDSFRFYEINPLVQPVAERWFTYLRDSGASFSFAQGDGRASLAADPARGFDVLVVDAFSGDAIPLHLLTIEAMRVYQRQLAPGGVIAFHVSNQYLDLAPEIGALAGAVRMEARLFDSGEDKSKGEYRATWVLVSGVPGYLDRVIFRATGARITPVAGVGAWTDDYSSLWRVVRWSGGM